MAMTLSDTPAPDALDNLAPYSKIAPVAAALDVSPATVYRLCDEGVIESVKIGGSRRVVTASLRSRLAGQ